MTKHPGHSRGHAPQDEPPEEDGRLTISAHADYRREDFMFRRQQSPEMRAAEWERRLPPLKPWAPNFVANIALGLFA